MVDIIFDSRKETTSWTFRNPDLLAADYLSIEVDSHNISKVLVKVNDKDKFRFDHSDFIQTPKGYALEMFFEDEVMLEDIFLKVWSDTRPDTLKVLKLYAGNSRVHRIPEYAFHYAKRLEITTPGRVHFSHTPTRDPALVFYRFSPNSALLAKTNWTTANSFMAMDTTLLFEKGYLETLVVYDVTGPNTSIKDFKVEILDPEVSPGTR